MEDLTLLKTKGTGGFKVLNGGKCHQDELK